MTSKLNMAAIVAAVVAAAAAAGCSNPNVPSATSYTCATQPRGYYNPATGQSTSEVDHYTQSTPCPATPIQ